MKVFVIPSHDDLFGRAHPDFSYDKTFEQARNEPLVVLHTSGTTGLPKPITWTHDWASGFVWERMLLPPEGFERTEEAFIGERTFSLFPPFHVSLLMKQILILYLSSIDENS